MELLSERLKQLRLEKKQSQEGMARVLATSYSTYKRYEAGEREPQVSMLIKMADYFGVTIDYLVGRTDA